MELESQVGLAKDYERPRLSIDSQRSHGREKISSAVDLGHKGGRVTAQNLTAVERQESVRCSEWLDGPVSRGTAQGNREAPSRSQEKGEGT